MTNKQLKVYVYSRRLLLTILAVLGVSYIGACLFLFVRQRYIIFRPSYQVLTLPSSPDYKLPYEDVRIPVSSTDARLRGWWIPAPSPQEQAAIPNEPVRILKSSKVILYLGGTGGNRSYYLARIQGIRQLGFSVLIIDYRGYGESKGDFPGESQFYEDSQAAWDYLTQVRHIPPKQIVIYGESLGGAIALNLAVKHPEAGGLIMQSTFTSMAETIKRLNWYGMFPIDLLLTQRFDSIEKVRSLRLPVLFIHGTADNVVPYDMSQQLYNAAPEPKQLLLIPKAGHFQIYQPGSNSYLRAIQNFVYK